MKTENRRERLGKLIAALCATFDKEFAPILVEVFDKALHNLSIEEIDFAAGKWVATLGKKFPTPVDLREAIQGDPKTRSHAALQLLVNAMEQSGSYKSVSFEDQALMVAIESYGGWPEICLQYRDLTYENLSYWEHRFREVYQSALKMPWSPKSKYLTGIYERHNSENAGTFTRGNLLAQEIDIYGTEGRFERKELAEFHQKQLSK